jgi:AraC-like DNA-binding protein
MKIMKISSSHFSKQVTEARQIYIGLERVKSNDDFRVISTGCERCLPEYVVDRASFPQFSADQKNWKFTTFDFVTQGKGSLTLNRSRHRLIPGTLYSYTQNTPHRISTDKKMPMLKYFLVCAHRSSVTPFGDVSPEEGGVFHLPSLDEVIDLFELLLTHATASTEIGNRVCDSITKALILKICEIIKSPKHSESQARQTYVKILSYIRNNYYRIKAIEQLSDELNLDPTYLSRIFKKFHQETPYKFLTRLKMSHAASLLLNSGYLVKHVAYELGFENPFHFSRSFKSIYGLSPENFVLEHKKVTN